MKPACNEESGKETSSSETAPNLAVLRLPPGAACHVARMAARSHADKVHLRRRERYQDA